MDLLNYSVFNFLVAFINIVVLCVYKKVLRISKRITGDAGFPELQMKSKCRVLVKVVIGYISVRCIFMEISLVLFRLLLRAEKALPN